jgi:uncharacterized protein YndB with AHSA1/START domain
MLSRLEREGLLVKQMLVALSFLALSPALPAPVAAEDSSAYRREAVISGPADLVWSLLTTDAGLRSWLAPQADVDLRVGGLVRTHQDPEGRLGDDQTTVSRVIALKKGRGFTVRLEQAPKNYPLANYLEGTWYDVVLESLPGGRTRIRCDGNGLATGWAAAMIRPAFNQGVDLVFDHLERAVAKRLEREAAAKKRKS